MALLNELIANWEYHAFDFHEMDTSKIRAYLALKANPRDAEIQQQVKMMREALKNSADTAMTKINDKTLREIIDQASSAMGGPYLLGQDNAIIGIWFAQLVLEGRVDKDIKDLTITAIRRQLLPVLIDRYDEGYREARKRQLKQMMEVMGKVGK